MGIPTFTQGYPPDGSSLGQTKAVIRDNIDGTFLTLAVDHVNNNGQPTPNPAGYHKIIHQVTQTNVSTISGVNQVFSGIPGTLIVNGITTPTIPANGDTQLYSLTGMGGLSQLTGNSATANGYCWVGGILIQWGTKSSSGGVQNVTLPIPFPKNFFISQATMIRNSGNVDTVYALTTATVGVVTTISFRDTSSGNSFFWFAIGN